MSHDEYKYLRLDIAADGGLFRAIKYRSDQITKNITLINEFPWDQRENAIRAAGKSRRTRHTN